MREEPLLHDGRRSAGPCGPLSAGRAGSLVRRRGRLMGEETPTGGLRRCVGRGRTERQDQGIGDRPRGGNGWEARPHRSANHAGSLVAASVWCPFVRPRPRRPPTRETGAGSGGLDCVTKRQSRCHPFHFICRPCGDAAIPTQEPCHRIAPRRSALGNFARRTRRPSRSVVYAGFAGVVPAPPAGRITAAEGREGRAMTQRPVAHTVS